MTGQVPFLPWAELKTGLYRWNGDYSQIKNATAGFAIQITPSLNFRCNALAEPIHIERITKIIAIYSLICICD
jgi:hypothetical protein